MVLNDCHISVQFGFWLFGIVFIFKITVTFLAFIFAYFKQFGIFSPIGYEAINRSVPILKILKINQDRIFILRINVTCLITEACLFEETTNCFSSYIKFQCFMKFWNHFRKIICFEMINFFLLDWSFLSRHFSCSIFINV